MNEKRARRVCQWLQRLAMLALVMFATQVYAQTNPTPDVKGCVYGGGRQADVNGNAKVTITKGYVEGSVYGGNDISGKTENPSGNENAYGVRINGGHVGQNVFGGSNGYYGCHGAETSATIAYSSDFDNSDGVNVMDPVVLNIPMISKTYVEINGEGVQIDGSVYGGGNLAPINNSINKAGVVHVVVKQGTIGTIPFDGTDEDDYDGLGNVFIGGNMASVYGTPTLEVDNTNTSGYYDLTINGGVYGGNDKSGTIQKSSSASARKSSLNPSSDDVTANASYVLIEGAPTYIGAVFGGGNGNYTYISDATEFENSTAANKILQVCGISTPNQSVPSFVDIHTAGGYIANVFGGGNSATVAESTSPTNYTQNVGSQVLLNTTSTTSGNATYNNRHVGKIFGGNNNVALNTVSNIILNQGSVEEVYGGGNAGDITGEMTYASINNNISTIIDIKSTYGTQNVGTIYGGCNKANISGATYINVADANATIGTIYGGCNISGNVADGSNVLVSNGQITDAVFGGANGFYGCPGSNGKYASDFDDNDGVDVDTTITMPTINTTNVAISSNAKVGTSSKSASIYGGGNMATVGTTANNEGVAKLSVTGGTIYGNVYGGGNMASVNGVTDFSVSGGSITGDVYGGNDKSGSVSGVGRSGNSTLYGTEQIALTSDNAAAYVKITGAPTITGSVFGGGNGNYTYYTDATEYASATEANKIFACSAQKPVQHSAFVDINIAKEGHIDSVYGGGNNATVGNVVNSVVGSANVWLNMSTVDYADANASIGTIFGGNNQADMNVLPNLMLNKGHVTTVYGGGNAGRMLGAAQLPAITAGTDLSAGVNEEEYNFSTFVAINSGDFRVNTVYGGCNQADVLHNTYVRLVNSYDSKAIAYLFGGNDMSGNIGDTSFVDIQGTGIVKTLFAGSNGMKNTLTDEGYEYTSIDRPNVGVARLFLEKGEVQENIYGGGWGANTGDTYVTIDGETKLTGEGTKIFGGGCGNIDEIGKCNATGVLCATDPFASTEHVGNVTGTAHLDLKDFDESSVHSTKPITDVFGGGHAGDVNNTELHLFPSWKYKLQNIYGGCYASNVYGTAHSNIEGNTSMAVTAEKLYGGNDYAGYVYNTVMDIRTGNYESAFGGGNGAYVYKGATPYNDATDLCRDTVPVSYNITVNFDPEKLGQLTFSNNVYGGGNEGYVYNYCNIKPSVASDHTVTWTKPDGTILGSTPFASADDYSTITVNIHGGNFANNVHAGGKGNASRIKHLIYGLKQLNMDGGNIGVNLYGGSEAVDDGYPNESVVASTDKWSRKTAGNASSYTSLHPGSSMRPSTIMNVIGGTIGKNIYGGGYEGNIYGSVYVNVGRSAVTNSFVWSTIYNGGTTPEYANNNVIGPTDAQTEHFRNSDLIIRGSVYGASDWGEAGTKVVFDTKGVYGGETRILIDGEHYNTTASTTAEDGYYNMEIQYSIIGAGTSTDGGDLLSHIHLKNYGDYEGCEAARELYSIQRADSVIFDHAFIELKGESDAFSAFPTTNYSLARIDNLIYHDKNVTVLDSPSEYILHLRSEDANGVKIQYTESELDAITASQCNEANVCTIMSGETHANYIYCNNGTYFKMQQYVQNTVDGYSDLGTGSYGEIDGYIFFEQQPGTSANLFSRIWQENDGGLLSVCMSKNVANPGITVSQSTTVNELPSQAVYINDVDENGSPISPTPYDFRKWTIGSDANLQRRRAVSIIATSNLSLNTNTAIDEDYLPAYGTDHAHDACAAGELAYATASIEMPPSMEGNYYKITSIMIDQANGEQVKLVDAAYDDHLYGSETVPGDHYISWKYQDGSPVMDTVEHTDVNLYSEMMGRVYTDPNFTFGLLMQQGDLNGASAFSDTRWTYHEGQTDQVQSQNQTLLSGNEYFESHNGYVSNKIARTDIVPVMDFTLTYSPNLTSTIVRDVVFSMEEYKSNGTSVGPVEITVTIATVVRELKDIDVTMLAMYNEGVSNEYSRQVVLPATMKKRPLTLKSVEWHPVTSDIDPATGSPYTISKSKYFPGGYYDEDGNPAEMSDPDATFIDGDFNMVSWDTPISDRKHFALKISPVEAVTDNISTSLGWFAKGESIDVYKVAADKQTVAPETQPAVNGLINPFGTLDGRATASVDISMKFDGNRIYKDLKTDYAGTAVLVFSYDKTEEFKIKIHVKTRMYGDTIYLASHLGNEQGQTPNPLTRNGYELLGHPTNGGIETGVIDKTKPETCGKVPEDYFHSFDMIMKRVYEEGDIICILDTVTINTNKITTIRGTDFSSIQVIRYSGSHYQFPGEACAYRGPMIKLRGAANELGLYNMWFNGSGLTKVKHDKKIVDVVSNPLLEITAAQVTADKEEADWTEPVMGGYYSSENFQRVRDTLFSEAPMFWVESGKLVFYSNVKLTNNFNRASLLPAGSYIDPTDDTSEDLGDIAGANSNRHNLLGGAIGIRPRPGMTTDKPIVMVGNQVVIEENVVIDHTQAFGSPKNNGAAIYVDGGSLQLAINKRGVGTNNLMTITDNYFLPRTSDLDLLVIDNTIAPIDKFDRIAWDVNGQEQTIPEFILVPQYTSSTDPDESFSLTYDNVYLTRTPYAGTDLTSIASLANDKYYQKDAQSDVITLNQILHKDARIGVSKWFPGDPRLREDNDDYPTVSGMEAPRDTIMFATGTSSIVSKAFSNDNFILNRDLNKYSDSNYFVFYHTSVSPTLLYLQRCATFRKKTLSNPEDATSLISFMDYKMNPAAVKPDGSDMVNVKFTGGFLPYTYSLYSVDSEGAKPEADATPIVKDVSQAINTTTDATLRAKAEDHDMLLRDMTKSNEQYDYYLLGTDLTGNCPIAKNFSVNVVQCQESPYHETDAWLNSSTLVGYRVPNADTSNWNETGNVHIFSDTNLVNVARALRTFKGFHLKKLVDPDPTTGVSSTYGTIASYIIEDPSNPTSWTEVDFTPSGTDPTVPAVPDKGKTGEGDHIYTPGDVVKVTAVPSDPDEYDFMMWDFDPSNTTPTGYFVVPVEGDNDALDADGEGKFTVTATAYFAPKDYWWQNVTSLELTNPDYYDDPIPANDIIEGRQYRVENSGKVTIKGPLGLAWLISTVNGYNGENARTFAFDTIVIEGQSGSDEIWDMSAHKWTPLGNMTNTFEGIFVGDPNVTITGITLNESEVPYVGFFGHTQEATLSDVKLSDMVARGNNYVGGIAAFADKATEMKNPSVANTTLAGAHSVAPISALAIGANISGATAEASQIVGYSIYSAGLVAEAEGSTITNATSSSGDVINPEVTQGGNGTAMVSGGVAAKTNSATTDFTKANLGNRIRGIFGLAPRKTQVEVPTVIENCYVQYSSNGQTQNVGGLVGFAENTQLSNSYVYGQIKATDLVGSLAAMVGDDVQFDHCYYHDATGNQIFGYDNSGNSASNTSSFKGSANKVNLETPVDGVNNLTRVLNKWVFAHDTSVYRTWRSDLESVNNGYPVFGTPDIIPVFDTLRVASCEMFDWDGIEFYESSSFSTNTIDSTEFIDSTFTLIITINHGDSTFLTDSVVVGNGYQSNGFYFSEDEINNFFLRGSEFTVVDFADTLQNANGCDSIVSLKLYILGNNVGIQDAEQVLAEVKVYPNPTLALVNVEASELKRVELYDQLSRLVDVKQANGNNKVQFDLTNHSTGSYYLRIETGKGAVVRKVIKK